MQVKYSQATSLIIAYIMAKIVPMLYGSPGIGKSAIIHAIAEKFNLLVIDLRLAQCDPTDLLGFPHIVNGRSCYVPMETFPLEGDEIPIMYDAKGNVTLVKDPDSGQMVPKRYAGWLLFMDEFTSASRAVQAAAYKIILDRMVGQKHLHKNVAICCAGNMETDNAIVEEMSTALQSRMAHLELVLAPTEWIDWANANGFDHRITDLIGFQPSNLYTFKPDHTDHTYASPRTWEFLNRLMKQIPPEAGNALEAYSGVVSEGVARTFLAHCDIYKTLPKLSKIEADPEHVDVPDEPSVLYALTGAISDHANDRNLASLLKYVSRMPEEMQIVTMRSTIRRNKAIFANKDMQKWMEKMKVELYA